MTKTKTKKTTKRTVQPGKKGMRLRLETLTALATQTLAKVNGHDVVMHEHIDELTAIQKRLKALEADSLTFQAMTGGAWRTARGETLMIRQMSDGHLEQAIKWMDEQNSANPGQAIRYAKAKTQMREEQERRKRDLEHRTQEATLKLLRERRLNGLSPEVITRVVDGFMTGKDMALVYQPGDKVKAKELVQAELRRRGVISMFMPHEMADVLNNGPVEGTIRFVEHRHTVVMPPPENQPSCIDTMRNERKAKEAEELAKRQQLTLGMLKLLPHVGDLFGNYDGPKIEIIAVRTRNYHGTTMASYVEARILPGVVIHNKQLEGTLTWTSSQDWQSTNWHFLGRKA